MDIGRKIYYAKYSGVIIWDKGEMSGAVHETTFAEDCEAMPILALVNDNGMLCVVQLDYGAYAEQFITCKGYIINPETHEPQFVF